MSCYAIYVCTKCKLVCMCVCGERACVKMKICLVPLKIPSNKQPNNETPNQVTYLSASHPFVARLCSLSWTARKSLSWLVAYSTLNLIFFICCFQCNSNKINQTSVKRPTNWNTNQFNRSRHNYIALSCNKYSQCMVHYNITIYNITRNLNVSEDMQSAS